MTGLKKEIGKQDRQISGT